MRPAIEIKNTKKNTTVFFTVVLFFVSYPYADFCTVWWQNIFW